MIIQYGMTINIRTQEELEMFYDVAEKEGYKWRYGKELRRADICAPRAISVGYRSDDRYPMALSHQPIAYPCGEATDIVEASQLFRNQLISKRRNLH